DKQREEYFSRIDTVDDKSFKNLARSFLNKSGYYGGDGQNIIALVKLHGVQILTTEDFKTEFDRRSVPKYGPQWEGITWVLDLLPHEPLDAIAAIRAFIRAHIQQFTDQMVWGHYDVLDMIQRRYGVTARQSCFISFGGPDEPFARKLFDALTTRGFQAF